MTLFWAFIVSFEQMSYITLHCEAVLSVKVQKDVSTLSKENFSTNV